MRFYQGGVVKLALLTLLISLHALTFAITGSAPENNQKYAFYYQFADKSLANTSFQGPNELVRAVPVQVLNTINLLLWKTVSNALPVAPEPYDREKHFGDWIVIKKNGNCLNVRALVLRRDSLSKVVMVPGKECFVQSGKWYDPYGNMQYTSAADIQIDHFVPLKHVYFSGGFQWDARTKCLYANYQGYRNHLVPVSGTENARKSDGTPYSYLPPNKSFTCNYLANWLKIKKIWNLALIPPEVQAIAAAFKENRCDAKLFNMNLDELVQQRKYMNDNYRLCDNASGGPKPMALGVR